MGIATKAFRSAVKSGAVIDGPNFEEDAPAYGASLPEFEAEQPETTHEPEFHVNGETEPPSLKLVHETDVPDPEEFDGETVSDSKDDATAARASALRAILINGEDAKSAEWRIKRQWPRLKDTAAAIVGSAQRRAENWMPGTERMVGGALRLITSVELINESFVLIAIPGQASCVAQRSDAYFMSKDDFRIKKGIADAVIVTGIDNKGGVVWKEAAKIWISDRRRRTATKVVFTNKEVGHECFNLFTGFGVTPKKGCSKLIHRHIYEVICDRDIKKYKAFIKLEAWKAQNIGEASRIIVNLYSEKQQAGKGVLLEKILRPMYGLHGIFTADAGKVLGKFNDLIKGKAYSAFDEACFAGKKEVADTIKSISGTESASVEGKGLPVIELPIAVNVYMLTNHEHSAHVEWGDKRYWILKVAEHRIDDTKYWAALRHEIKNGGIEAFLFDLLAIDVSGFIPQRDVPRDNAEHRANKISSDPVNPAIWLLECLDNGVWLGSENWQGKYARETKDGATGELTPKTKKECGAVDMFVPGKRGDKFKTLLMPAFLEYSYRAWASAKEQHAKAATTGNLWKLLTKFGLEVTGRTSTCNWRVLPPEAEIRAKIVDHMGFDCSDYE